MTSERERSKTYDREERNASDPVAPMPIAPNTLGAGAGVIVPPAVEDEADQVERVANETADPVKERAHGLPPGQEYREPSQHNPSGEALVSEIQRQTGIGGGSAPATQPGALAVGSGATAHGDDGQRTLFAAPRSDAEQISVIAEGSQLVLLEGPHAALGLPWWNVRLPDGRTGWVQAAALMA